MEADQARAIIGRSRRIIFFTGAGISAESGIPTFRDSGGLWQSYDPVEFANALGIAKQAIVNPRRLAHFAHDFLAPIVHAVPNDGHFAITQIQRRLEVSIVTQNVDGLHQRSGSSKVIELHGSVYQSRRVYSTQIVPIEIEELRQIVDRLANLKNRPCTALSIIRALNPAARVGLTGIWLPNLVLFGQMLPADMWNEAVDQFKRSDCLVVVGTSLNVYPAASLVLAASRTGIPVIQIDPHEQNEYCVTGLAATVLPEICA